MLRVGAARNWGTCCCRETGCDPGGDLAPVGDTFRVRGEGSCCTGRAREESMKSSVMPAKD